MASQYWTISFNDTLFLTSDGTTNGLKCRLTETGVETLQSDYLKTKAVDIHSNVMFFKNDIGKKNRTIELNVARLPKTIGEDLIDLRVDQDENDTAITMQGTHDDLPSFDLDVELTDIIYSDARNGFWNDVIIRVTSYGENI